MTDNIYPYIMLKNSGQWLEHKIVEPGIMEHTAKNGNKIYTMRYAAFSSVSIINIREVCELADKHCDGRLNFTTGSNVEFIVNSVDKIKDLKADLASSKVKNGTCKFALRQLAPGLSKFA
jgi:sulfite reductase beta subunit